MATEADRSCRLHTAQQKIFMGVISAREASAKGKTTHPVIELMDTCHISFLGK